MHSTLVLLLTHMEAAVPSASLLYNPVQICNSTTVIHLCIALMIISHWLTCVVLSKIPSHL